MSENQNIEYKESWRDEYLKWVCGFANAQGGKIYIGKDDNGKTCGLAGSKKLMEDIPNKIRNTLGIVVDVNLHKNDLGEYIEIIVEPQPYPISYYGEYHYRSGATKQQLTGQQLNQFLLKKTGLTWDSVPISNIPIEKIRNDAFDIFKEQSVKNGRMSKENVDIDNIEILDSLNLIDENNELKRAGVLLFHHTPEKWVPGSFIKIAYFSSESEIDYQDEIHGPLLSQPDKIMDLIFTKYLKAKISYDGITRVENYPFPKPAVREAVLNAIAHKNYATLVPIQIRVYNDKLVVSNDCIFPEDWTVEDLMKQHKSRPYNPLIANAFYRAGFIESWGRGIQKIKESCSVNNCEEPVYQVTKNDFTIIFESVVKNNGDSLILNEGSLILSEVYSKIDDVPNEKLSDNEKKRLKLVIDELVSIGFVNGSIAAEIIGVSAPTARRLLSKSEKLDILKSEGSTGNKKYFLNN